MAAAEHCQIPVFDYLFEHSSAILSQEEKIDALELLGKLIFTVQNLKKKESFVLSLFSVPYDLF